MRLSAKMEFALELAMRGRPLICAYGNQFFIAGSDGRETVERSTLEALRERGLLQFRKGMTMRGEYFMSKKEA